MAWRVTADAVQLRKKRSVTRHPSPVSFKFLDGRPYPRFLVGTLLLKRGHFLKWTFLLKSGHFFQKSGHFFFLAGQKCPLFESVHFFTCQKKKYPLFWKKCPLLKRKKVDIFFWQVKWTFFFWQVKWTFFFLAGTKWTFLKSGHFFLLTLKRLVGIQPPSKCVLQNFWWLVISSKTTSIFFFPNRTKIVGSRAQAGPSLGPEITVVMYLPIFWGPTGPVGPDLILYHLIDCMISCCLYLSLGPPGPRHLLRKKDWKLKGKARDIIYIIFLFLCLGPRHLLRKNDWKLKGKARDIIYRDIGSDHESWARSGPLAKKQIEKTTSCSMKKKIRRRSRRKKFRFIAVYSQLEPPITSYNH